MQSIRLQLPIRVHRVSKPTAAISPNMYCTRNASFFPRFAHSEFAQVARLLDEVTQFPNTAWGRSLAGTNHSNHTPSHFRSFQPRFDVRESKDAYELTGELPGVSDIDVEFTDATTLTIKGRSTHSRDQGARPAGLGAAAPTTTPTPTQPELEGEKLASSASSIADSETSSAYHKASVEDENGVATPAGSTANDAVGAPAEASPAVQPQQEPQATPPQEPSKYWLSERSVGEFARTFTFPARVDQEAVKASLKDGILSVVVPKAAPATRRINVE